MKLEFEVKLTLLLRVHDIPLSEEAGEILGWSGKVMVGFRGEVVLRGGGVVVGLIPGRTALGEMIPFEVEVGRAPFRDEEGEVTLWDPGSWNPVTKLVEGRLGGEVARKVDEVGRRVVEVGRRVVVVTDQVGRHGEVVLSRLTHHSTVVA